MYKLFHKIIQFVALFCVLLNSFSPFFYVLPKAAYAQELDSTSSPQATVTPAQDVSPTAAPTQEVTPVVTATPTEVPTPTDVPTATVNPTPTEVPTVAPTEAVANNSPPTGKSLSVVVLDNTSAPTIDLSSYEAQGSASLTTDKTDYSPTDTALISGSGFNPGLVYTLVVTSTDAPAVNFSTKVTASSTGAIAYAYQLDGNYRPNYQVAVKDSSGTTVATTTFTDSNPATDISQCQNGGIGDPLQPCSETAPFAAAGGYGYEGNANANGTNSHWVEGDFVPLRIVATNYSAGSGNIQFSIDVTKGGKHAYDYIGSFDATETTGASSSTHANHNNPCGDITGATGDCIDPVNPDSTGLIPAANLAGSFPVACGSNTFAGSQVAGNVVAWGTSGPLTVTYVSENVGSSDCTTTIQVAWTATQASFGGTIVIGYAPHIAKQSDWGTGNSAINISGSPYHSSLVQYTTGGVTKGIGQQDAKLSANAVIVPSTITVHKVTSPSSDTTTSFPFTTTGTGYAGFSLTGGGQNSQTVTPGSYTVTETSPAPAYANTALTCTATGTGSSATPTLGSRSVAITIGSAGGAVIDCIYTNTLQQGTIELKKVWVGTAGQTTLQIGTSAGGVQVDTQLTGVSGAAPLTTGQNIVNPGTFYLSETGGLADYTTAALSCFNDADNNGTNNGESSVTVGASDSVSVLSNQHVICTYINTRKQGKIELQKDFVGTPENVTIKIGTAQNGSQVDSDVLSADGTDGEHTVDTGGYFVSEVLTTPANYTSSLVCSDDNNHNNVIDGGDTSHTVNTTTGAVSVGNNDDVICKYTNTRKTGTIELKKVWSGTAGQTTLQIGSTAGAHDVDTQLTGAAGGAPLTTGQNPVDTGTYYLSETGGLANYTPSALVCFNDANNNGTNDSESSVSVGANDSVAVADGQHVICSYTNTRNTGTIIVKKVMVGGTSTFDFTGTPNGSISSNNGTIQATVDTGSYSSTEAAKTGWDFTSVVCDDNNSTGDKDTRTASFNVGSGETVTCTFTNTKKPKLTVVKVTDPANDTGKFNLSINSTQYATDVSNGGTTNAQYANIGANTFAEAAGTGTSLSNYTSVVSGEGCGGSATAGTITLAAGDDKTCTITNTRKGSITIKKVTIGGDSSFTFTGDVAGSLSNNQTSTQQVVPGTYHSTESAKSGWALTDITCNDSNSTGVIGTGVATFIVGAGENVTCTFTNNKPAAQIDLSPLTATNKVGENHVITATVQVQNGDGTWGSPVDGTVVTFAITNSNGATAVFVPASPNTCTTIAGSCSITINSPTPGHVVVNASASPSVLGVSLPVSTGTGGDNSADAQKDYVNARISIAPHTSTNEVNDDHSFTVTVEKNTGAAWVPVPAGTLANAIVSPSTSLDVSDCTDGVNASGQCTVIVNSSIVGVFTITARSTVVVGGVTFKLQTNGTAPNSGPAVKTYVDASIALTPQTATNNVNDPHTITAHVTKNGGSGVVNAAGVTVTFTVSSGSATFVGGDNDCVTDAGGLCSIHINSSTPGANTIDATTTFTVGGVSLTRSTNGDYGPDGTDSAEKNYVAGRIIVRKVTVGGDGVFNFNADYSEDFQLSNGESNNSGYIPTGTHSVSEDSQTGWDLTSATCVSSNADSETPASISLQNGETVTCTFTNTKRGNITIVKDAQPNDLIDFSFNGTNGLGAFQLDDDAGVSGEDSVLSNSKTFSNKVPGSYTVTETLPNSFWAFGGVSCVLTGTTTPYANVANTTNGVIITLDPGADVTCTFVNTKESPTRTLGFWQTHTAYTSSVFASAPISSNMPIGTAPHKGFITTTAQLFGAFYSNISKTSTGGKRTPLDQARMQLLQQLVAAKLNCAAFGCATSVQTLITAADAAYAGTSTSAILASAALLDLYNNSGDTITIGSAGSATPKTSQSLANKAFWDTP